MKYISIMKHKYYIPAVLSFSFIVVFSGTSHAQNTEQKLTHLILHKDSLFWQSYNRCDTTGYDQFFSNDVEFYHDRGGIQKGKEEIMSVSRKNLCSNKDFKIRREAVNGSIRLFPMARQDSLYGAVLSGEHYFYVTEGGHKERLSGLAKFTHLWILNGGVWKMSRILSYDHGPAPAEKD